MQKLQAKLKNVPVDVFQVHCSTNLELNSNERDSAQDSLKNSRLTCNNLEGNQPQQAERLKKLELLVFVLNIDGKLLMPCKPQKAKQLLRAGKAKVITKYPFTIQLLITCSNKVQPISLGMDSGYQNIGVSCITETKELFSCTMTLDGKTSERLTNRRMYRNNKRSRHHWYRKSRFSNRKKQEGWLPPSVQRRYDTHLNLIKKIKQFLPITSITIEVAKFDIQKIQNPEIEGVGYQQGEMYGYQNVRNYLMNREQGKCQLCGKIFKQGNGSHVHHIQPRSKGGTNKVSNLALLHKSCHDRLHREGLYNQLKKSKSYKPNTFMSIINKRFQDDIKDLNITYGYITFIKRNELGLPKSHSNDAFIIAGGKDQERYKEFKIEQKHRHNRVLQRFIKGVPRIRKQRYLIQPKDLVMIDGKWFKSHGMQNKGTQIQITSNHKRGYDLYNIKKVQKFFNFGSFIWN